MRWKLETDESGRARWTALSRFAGPGFESTGATVEERTHRNGSSDDAFGGAKTWPAVTARVELPAGRPELQAELARELRETITRFAWAHDLAVEPSPWVKPGVYPWLEIVACHRRESTSPSRHRVYTVELEVKSRPEGALGDEHTAGARVAWVMREGPSLALFLAAAFEIDVSEVTTSTVARAFGVDQPLQGVDLWCEATELETRQGRAFVQCRWVRL